MSANVYSNASTVGNLNGFFKEVYADKLELLIPDGVFLLTKVKFVSKDKQGGMNYNQPVILGLEHGITFAASEDDAFALNNAIAGQIKNATIQGSHAMLRSILGVGAASRATDKNSFMDATKFLVANMLRSMAKKLEIEMLYGQSGYGVVSAVSGAVITIATAEWAPGIWAGAEKLPVEIRDSTGATVRGSSSVVSVSMDNKTVTLLASIAGVVAGDIVWHANSYGKEFKGIHSILKTSGTLFGIDNTEYNLFKGNEYDAGGSALSFTKLNLAVARAVEKGLDSKLTCLVNVKAWANMLSEQAALRKYDDSYSASELQNGSKSLKFFAQNGELEIIPSIFVKEGYAYMLSIEDFIRVGSSDMSFKRPGADGNFFKDQENNAGYELRLYTDQAIFTSAPGKSVLIKNIVNSN